MSVVSSAISIKAINASLKSGKKSNFKCKKTLTIYPKRKGIFPLKLCIFDLNLKQENTEVFL